MKCEKWGHEQETDRIMCDSIKTDFIKVTGLQSGSTLIEIFEEDRFNRTVRVRLTQEKISSLIGLIKRESAGVA